MNPKTLSTLQMSLLQACAGSPAMLAAWLGTAATACMAQGLPDPTRPPPMLMGAASAPQAARAASAAAVPTAAPPRLLSIQVPREGEPSALVDDRLLRVGDRLGDGTVAAIDAQGISLRSPKGGVERLSLLNPGIVKQAVAPGARSQAPVASLAEGKQP